MSGGPKRPLQGFEAVALVSQLGVVVAAPIVFGALLGSHLDDRAGTRGLFLILLTLLGIGGGIAGAYRIVKPYLK